MDTRTHGGNIWRLARKLGCGAREILDFSASINPFGPPSWLDAVTGDAVSDLRHYPDPDCSELLEAASRHYGMSEDELTADNGTAEILHRLPPLLVGDSGPGRAVIPVPAYADYAAVCAVHGLEVDHLPLEPRDDFALNWDRLHDSLREKPHWPTLVFLGQPNNPTGRTFQPDRLRALAAEHPGCWFIVDEAFADFVPGLDRLLRQRPPNVIVLLSLTKFYALPGLRIGLAAMDSALATRYRKRSPDWSVNTLAQIAGARCLQDAEFQRESRERTVLERDRFAAALAGMAGLRVFPSEANFLLCRGLGPEFDADRLAGKLLGQRIAIRACANFPGLDSSYFRLAVRRPEENDLLLDALGEALEPAGRLHSPARPRSRPRKRATPALMFQGTCSNAGKSLLTAALCRILRQDGFSPAPFKAQNMALNSGVTPDGGEIGRAQILQAQACGLEPDRRMNPILLKPNSETGSQVIVLGEPRGNMTVGAYIRAKEDLRGLVHDAYDRLAAEHDVMVLEGAGSPAEINLRHHDLVNMTMARHAQAAVYLVGDIDRGGVFAALSGTMDMLEKWERDLVRGLVINKFRGQRSLLDPALDWVARRTARPVLGVVPYLADLGLPEEDSVNFKQGALFRPDRTREADGPAQGVALDVACLDLPHISNFTDLDPLAAEPDVAVRLVRHAGELGEPDLLILPGSKNVMADMDFVRRRGLAEAVIRLAETGATHILGICGGYQMLGMRIEDPHGLESATRASIPGLGLLALTTRLEPDKTLRRTVAGHPASGLEVAGYEIHHGQSVPEPGCDDLVVALKTAEGRVIGLGLRDKPVWGSYLHGIFDDAPFRRWLTGTILAVKGRSPLSAVGVWDMEAALDRLADHVRRHLDIARIYDNLGGQTLEVR
ncbi:cobyric acid synthase [Desulfonatronum sp. SC1]|uniref:cobyric acid synthase n=1 Tax=Desulfonatronum sp. SC1 TaxID=2109626 RepID=UPI000D3110E5|nr:cobyric acid synthase [Desulfonatronum sp. SC1]PTN34490.1 threonine-phosphate decarboxylase [Desulfonatronum sp. SC1]